MPEQIERDYIMDDLAMLERAQVFHNAFVLDKAAFVADFPHLDDPFAANFQTAIDTADAIPSAQEVDGEIATVTFDLNEQLPLARKALQKLYAYVDIVWTKGQKNSAFGRTKYEKVRQSQTGLKELLEQANRQAEITANKTALLAAGYTQAAIDELKDISDTIDELNAEQEDMLAARFEKTRIRILAYNTVWDFMKQINKASKVTFADNSAKLELYLLYPTPSTAPHKVQGLAYNAGLNMLTWDSATNATLYIVEAMQQFPLSEPTFTMRAETPLTEWVVALPPATYSFRIKGKNGGVSGPYSDSLDNVVIGA